MLRSLFSFTTHAIILSTTLAGIQRCSGTRLNVEVIRISSIRRLCMAFLELGDYCLNYAIGFVKDSEYFVKAIKDAKD